MRQQFLLPSTNEWKQLAKLYDRVNQKAGLNFDKFLKKEIIFGFFAPMASNGEEVIFPTLTDNYAKLSRLVIYLSRDFWNSCPTPLLNVLKEAEQDSKFKEFLLGHYEVVAPIFGTNEKLSEFDRTSFLRFLKTLENECIIKSFSYKQWLQKYGEQAKILDNKDFMERSSAKIYPITGLGSILYEYIINAPLMYQSYLSAYFENNISRNILTRNQNRYNTSTNALITLSIATRSERLSLFLNSPFHFKDRSEYIFHSYHEEIADEQEKFLENQIEFFIQMHNPATKVLREIKCLQLIADMYDISNTKLSTYKKYDSEELIPKYLGRKIQNDISLLEEIWEDQLGLNPSQIKKYLPDFAI